jgi:hypothetical protein
MDLGLVLLGLLVAVFIGDVILLRKAQKIFKEAQRFRKEALEDLDEAKLLLNQVRGMEGPRWKGLPADSVRPGQVIRTDPRK